MMTLDEGLTYRPELVKSRSHNYAEVAKQADALRSGRSGNYSRVGSNPTFGTTVPQLRVNLGAVFIGE